MQIPLYRLVSSLFSVLILVQGCGPHILPRSSYIGEWRTEGGTFERRGSVGAGLLLPLEEAWRVKVGKGIKGSPVPIGEIVIVSTTDGKVKAYRIEDGKNLWSNKIKGGFFAAPVVTDGRVFISSEYPDGRLYCLTLERGDAVWEGATGPCRSGSMVDAGVVYTINNSGEIFSHTTVGGDLLWKKSIPSLQPQSPIVSGESLYLICGGNRLKIVSTVDGDTLGTIPFDFSLSGSAARLGDRIVLGSEKGVCIVSVSLEEKKIDLLETPETYRLAVSGDLILGTDGTRKAFVVDSRSRKVLWTRDTAGLLEASPVIAGNVGVIVTLSGEIKLLDMTKGHLLWEKSVDTQLSSAPVVSGGFLLLATERGELIAYSSTERQNPADRSAGG